MTINVFGTESASGKGTALIPLEAKRISGETDIDDSEQTESTAYVILTLTAPAEGAMDVSVWFDLAKATTGYAAVESTATIKFQLARKVDGTNYRIATDNPKGSVAISGTNAAGGAVAVDVGDLSASEVVQIWIDMSADATSDIELPYDVTYKSRGTITVTEVAAA